MNSLPHQSFRFGTIEDMSAAVSAVLVRYDVREVYLFGSFARGEQTSKSDVDLRLVCGESITFGDLYELSQELERAVGRPIDIVTNPPERMRKAFRDNIQSDEVLLYEQCRCASRRLG